VTNMLPPSTGFLDEPGMFSSLEIWEQFLVEVKAMPESAQKPQTILHAEYMIALKREELEPMPSNLPFLVAFIDEPGLFGNTLVEWEQFLAEMEELPAGPEAPNRQQGQANDSDEDAGVVGDVKSAKLQALGILRLVFGGITGVIPR
jgi:hypothetical protein